MDKKRTCTSNFLKGCHENICLYYKEKLSNIKHRKNDQKRIELSSFNKFSVV